MKTIELPIKKVVKYDAEGFAYPICPICGSTTLKVQLLKDALINMYCTVDNFTLHQKIDNTYTAKYTIYRYLRISYVQKQERALHKLLDAGLISYVDLLGYLKFGREELTEDDTDRLFGELEDL